MANMYITEYSEMVYIGAVAQIPKEPPLAVQKVAFTGTSAASAALNAATRFVSIQLDTNGHLQFADSPTATVATSRLHEANAISFHGVQGATKIAAITA